MGRVECIVAIEPPECPHRGTKPPMKSGYARLRKFVMNIDEFGVHILLDCIAILVLFLFDQRVRLTPFSAACRSSSPASYLPLLTVRAFDPVGLLRPLLTPAARSR